MVAERGWLVEIFYLLDRLSSHVEIIKKCRVCEYRENRIKKLKFKIKKEEKYSEHEGKLESIEEDTNPRSSKKKIPNTKERLRTKKTKWRERKSRYRCLMEKTTVCEREESQCTYLKMKSVT